MAPVPSEFTKAQACQQEHSSRLKHIKPCEVLVLSAQPSGACRAQMSNEPVSKKVGDDCFEVINQDIAWAIENMRVPAHSFKDTQVLSWSEGRLPEATEVPCMLWAVSCSIGSERW